MLRQGEVKQRIVSLWLSRAQFCCAAAEKGIELLVDEYLCLLCKVKSPLANRNKNGVQHDEKEDLPMDETCGWIDSNDEY